MGGRGVVGCNRATNVPVEIAFFLSFIYAAFFFCVYFGVVVAAHDTQEEEKNGT